MSADGKVTIQVDLDTSDVGRQLERLAATINQNKQRIKSLVDENKALNAEMANSSPAAAKKLQASIQENNQFIAHSKEFISSAAEEYKKFIKVMIESGAASNKSLGKTFFANLSNTKMEVPSLSELVASGKVDSNVTSLVAEYYSELARKAEEASRQVEEANDAMSQSTIESVMAQTREIRLLKDQIDAEVADQNELAQAILRVQLAYQSGKLDPSDMQAAQQEVAELANNFNECSLRINKYAQRLAELGQRGDITNIENLAERFNAESAAADILSNRVKDLTGNMLNNGTLQDRLAANVTKVTAQMRAEEAQVRRNAQAEREAARESAIAEREAKGRLTGTLGLLGMINPSFTRLSYAVRQFSKIGGISFKELENKVIGFGKALKNLPPQAKVALAAVAASVGTVVVSLTAMVKTIKTVISITKSLMGIAQKAGKAFLKFYDFDDYFGDVDKMVKAYNDLQANEVALASLMKSRMGATNEAVDAIKDLVVAEEAEGVVSKQNQTAALKHLAAYTTQTESLETLLPVLNDFTVQMYGVNATEQQSISAAKLFGKAMKGQTETLRRSGYVTEAQAKEIKNAANETERAALLAKYMGERCANMNEVLANTDSGKQQRLANSMAEVQREFGQAASVMKSTFIPVATQVLAVLARMASYAAALASAIAKIFGNTSKAAAAAVGEMEDVTSAAEGAGAAADKTKDKLGAYDELNVIEQDTDSGGGGVDAGIDPAMMEEDTGLIDDMTSAIDELLARIHDAYSAGFELGTAMKEALQQIPWDDIKQKAYEAGKSIAEFGNGIIDSGLIEQIGTTLGEGLNTVTEAFLGFVDNFDWASLGTTLANGLENFITTVDWGRIGKLLGDSLIGALKTINNFLESFDWASIGIAIADFLCGINWLELLGQVVEFIINALAFIFIDLPVAIIAMLKTIVDNIAKGITDYVNTNMEETGNNLVQAFLTGIVDVLATIATWVWDHVVTPIVMAFAKYFGVDSDEFHEFGENIINGFFDGIKEIIHDPLGWLKEHVVDPFVNAFKELFGIHSPSTVMYELGVFVIEGLFNGISSLVQDIKDIWEDLKKNANEIWTNIKNTLITLVTTIKTKVTSIWNGLKATITTVWNTINNTIRTVVNTIKSNVTSAFTTATSTATRLFNSMQSAISNAFTTLKNNIKSTINSILGFVESMANGVVRGVNKLLGAINNISIDLPDWAEELSGVGKLGFSFPMMSEISIPRLANGAVIPANREFMAILGDQKSGTNIETPLDTMVDAFKTALTDMGNSSNNQPIVLQLDGKVVAKCVWDENEKRYKQTGNTSFAY